MLPWDVFLARSEAAGSVPKARRGAQDAFEMRAGAKTGPPTDRPVQT